MFVNFVDFPNISPWAYGGLFLGVLWYLFIFNGFNIFIGFCSDLIRFLQFSNFDFVMIFTLLSENK